MRQKSMTSWTIPLPLMKTNARPHLAALHSACAHRFVVKYLNETMNEIRGITYLPIHTE